MRSALEKLAETFAPAETLFWAQNLALARNLILSDELAKFSARHGLALLSHHHDLWFENRWARWSEMRTCGFRSLAAVARASFAAKARVCHVTINKLDYAVLSKHLGSQAKCLPNLSERGGQPSRARIRAARDWLKSHLGDDCPVWIFPTRFLRRKNLAEAVLLARWLRPDAWFVTTAGVSSREERNYARRLESMALREKWKARFRILDSNNSAPPIEDIVMASEVMLLTSAQEGFGLPYLEAAAFEKPLIARHLPNVVPDLLELGFSFPHLYEEILIAPDLLDLKSERSRQQRLWREWKAAMPSLCRRLAKRPVLLNSSARRTSAVQPSDPYGPTGGAGDRARAIVECMRACKPLPARLARSRRGETTARRCDGLKMLTKRWAAAHMPLAFGTPSPTSRSAR